ncbi:hypothetical protein AG1IA_07719 [Rhizoctonia solani AG-1 IA]|uniref:Transmembrane protein n=1 Tax=Thanatephorus cucumeris (strain AG1-IA) TaxID=983506 RepID=L8WNC2_THACA|nr:hypothetical protein AG1IA_07719 [Rhizoctonia solani AG-1 IA]
MGAPSLTDLDQIGAQVLSSDKSFHLGPFLVATFVDTLFCGILLMQYGAYVSLGKNDTRLLKWMVVYVLTLNIASTILTWTWIYDLFLIQPFDNMMVTDEIRTAVLVLRARFHDGDCRTSIFWAESMEGRSWIVGILLVSLMLGALGGGIGIKALFTQLGSTLFAKDVRIPAYICLFCTVAADITITAISKSGHAEGVQMTDHMLARLARVTFSSQLPPTLIAIALAIEYTIKCYGTVIVRCLKPHKAEKLGADPKQLHTQIPQILNFNGANPARTNLESCHDIQLEQQVDNKQRPTGKDDTDSGHTMSVNVDVQGTTFRLSHFGPGLESQTRVSDEKGGSSISP